MIGVERDGHDFKVLQRRDDDPQEPRRTTDAAREDGAKAGAFRYARGKRPDRQPPFSLQRLGVALPLLRPRRRHEHRPRGLDLGVGEPLGLLQLADRGWDLGLAAAQVRPAGRHSAGS